MAKEQESVFEKYAHEYDLMTNAAAREKSHEQEVLALINRFHSTSVLDAGCATGLTAALFAKHGIQALGIDRSKRMLEVARQKYAKSGLPVQFLEASFEKLPRDLFNRFDLVVCLANSISGVGSTANLARSLKNFRRTLRPGGTLVLQMLNYSAVKSGEIMPIRATSNGGITYLRFTERVGRSQQLHAIRVDTTANPPAFEVFRHTFDNFTTTEVTSALNDSGFTRLRKFGKLDLTQPFARQSRDLIVVGQKP